jgi:prophage antirepressor-like protein
METNNQIIPFTFEDENEVRIIIIENEPWFVATDLCRILGYTNNRKTINDHCRADGVTKRYIIDSLNRSQEVSLLNEANLYRLIIKSKKPEAKKFESWVCDEVLPQIRKTGSYGIAGVQSADLENLMKSMFAKFKEELSEDFVSQEVFNEQVDEIYNHCIKTEKRISSIESRFRDFSALSEQSYPAPAYVYVMHNRQTDEYKIGQTTQPRTRQKQFQQVEPNIEITLTIPVASQRMANYLEKMLHEKFTYCHTSGEWYKLKPNDLDVIKTIAEVLVEAQF